jgi:hypothetical protein
MTIFKNIFSARKRHSYNTRSYIVAQTMHEHYDPVKHAVFLRPGEDAYLIRGSDGVRTLDINLATKHLTAGLPSQAAIVAICNTYHSGHFVTNVPQSGHKDFITLLSSTLDNMHKQEMISPVMYQKMSEGLGARESMVTTKRSGLLRKIKGALAVLTGRAPTPELN